MHMRCMYRYMHACCIFLDIVICTLKSHTHLKRSARGFCIGTLAVVDDGAVIETQSQVRLVVTKYKIINALGLRYVSRQKHCHPALQHCLILLK